MPFKRYCGKKYCTAGQATNDNMRVRIANWTPKATNTYSEYVILTAFPQQQRLHEKASMLRHTYTACLVDVNLGGMHSKNWGLQS